MSKIKEAHGLYITINGDFVGDIRAIKDAKADFTSEVTVELFGNRKHFELSDFLLKLGFKPTDV